MQYVLIIHEVEDYDSWKQVFDNAAQIRKQAGERIYQVLKYEHQPNKIVHLSHGHQSMLLSSFKSELKLV